MILLLSSSNDANIDYVIDWLRFHKHPYMRINADDLLQEHVHLSLTPPRFVFSGQETDLEAIKVVWLRKIGYFQFSQFYRDAAPRMRSDSLTQLAREYAATVRSLIALLENKHWLTHPALLYLNKLEVLLAAQKCGLAIPETRVLNRKADLALLVREGEYITKSIYDALFLKEQGGIFSMFTKEVGVEEVESFSEEFFPSLVQRKVAKEYDLRLFYLDGECYTMAIFSQQSPVSQLDFREFDWTKPTRSVPYELPREVEAGIQRLMTAIGLNCGSIDMIKGIDGRYYFLEVNPTGQFGMTSTPCNYPLFERVAEYLIENDR
jgi:ATP-GRASP peptide maturase of grasp-with-spasm system